MSGFTNVTGFAPPSSIAGFLGLLRTASFRGVPFKVIAAQVKKGRRLAIHEYPFRDGGWAEDMGRALRTYSFSGYLIGDLAPAMQLLLDNAVETAGPGLLIHPTIGAVKVALVSSGTAVHRDKMRVIEVAFEFIEQGGTVFPTAIIATVLSILAAADSALTAAGTDLGGVAVSAAAVGPAATGEGAAVVTSFAAATTLGGADPTAIVGMAAALPPPDPNTSYGRYGAGSASVSLPIGTTVASLQAQLANQRAALALAGAGSAKAAATFSASTDMMGALAALVEAMRAGITDPADQIRVLFGLAVFTFVDNAGGLVGVGSAMAKMRDAMAAACRRAALVSLARASASYQPVSYNDAASLRVSLAAVLDAEITAAGDAGEDATYVALKALRSAVVQDLTVRGASLPSVVTVRLQAPLPSLVIAQFLYRDASRSDGIAAEAGAIHPAFCPISIQALASGMGPAVNPVVGSGTSRVAGSVIVAPTSSVGVYHLPPPGGPLGLAVVSTTSATAVLSWSPATAGGLAASYVVQVMPSGAGTWSTVAMVMVTGSTVAGLGRNMAYDFQVLASNVAGTGPASAIATGVTTAAAPNAVGSLACGTVTANAVALSWTGSVVDSTHDAAASYAVQYRVTGLGAWLVGPSGIMGTSISVTGLVHATGYDFQVIAMNSGGSAVSSIASATTTAAAPNAPASLTVAPVADGTTTKLPVAWAASTVDSTHDAATAYTVQIRLHGAGTWSTVYTGAATSCTAIGLSAGTSYDVQVTASNGGGTGGGIIATGSTYSTVMSWHTAPASSYVHGSGGNAVNAYTTPNPSGSVGVDFWWSTSATSNTEAFGPSKSRTAGGTDNGYPIWTNVWGAYLNAPTTPGTYYAWALVHDGSGVLVSGAIAVT